MVKNDSSESLKCLCCKPHVSHLQFDSKYVGVDKTNGCFADVSLLTCKSCHQIWLQVLIENEGFTQSGRWCRGAIDPDIIGEIHPSNAEQILQSLDWYIIGGSFYDSTGVISEKGFAFDV